MTAKYRVTLAGPAIQALEFQLPPKIAEAVRAFIIGPLAENPYRVGKKLRAPLDFAYAARRGEYRILYQIDGDQVLVEVIDIRHRAKAYRA
jgi:mRNA-degrading endonuclease RelE of RelBE toxin-antitoxin system